MRHFSLVSRQGRRVIPMDYIISWAALQRFSGHLKIIRPLKLAKNSLILHILPAISQPAIFWVFAHRYSFEGLSEIRLRLFHLRWKADIESFLTGHHEPRFNIRKAAIFIQQVRGPFSGINMKYFCNFWTPKICFSQMCVKLFLSLGYDVKSI